jgi:hypothetical protein
MNILELIEAWAQEKGYWCYVQTGDVYGPRHYINLSKVEPDKRKSYENFITYYEDGKFCIDIDCYVDIKPADPRFFDVIESNILART